MAPSLAVIYAVVVGWNGSPSPEQPALRYADDDAAEYARLFRDAGARTTLLTRLDDDSRALHPDAEVSGPPTREALFAALARIDAEMEKDGAPGELYFVYGGHGDVDHGEGFVMLDGSRLTRADLHARVLGGRRARRVHVIVDACRSYFLAYARGGERTRHAAPFADETAPAGLPEVGFALSTSAGDESHEWEAYQGGVFSHEVRSALRGAADADGDGAISYAELSAFVGRANASITNPRFRPRFTIVPPRAAPERAGAVVLRWQPGAARRLSVDRASALQIGKISIEDGSGRRLLDAHLGGPAVLRLPESGTLYLASASADREYTVEPVPGDARAPIALATLDGHPRRVAARGAQNEAFQQLFALPYDQSTVAAYLASERAAGSAIPGEPSPRPGFRSARIAMLTTAVVAAASGLGCTFSALGLRRAADGGAQVDRAAANQRITGLNDAGIGLYALAGASAAVWATLLAWPQHEKPIPVAFAAGPGQVGQVGFSLSASFSTP